MKKKIKKAFEVSWLLILCLNSIFFTACKEQPKSYLESYISSEQEDAQSISERENTEENQDTETIKDRDRIEPTEVLDNRSEEISLVHVYVCGAVRYPGVYTLAEESRICDAISMAGGLLEDADELSVNQAQLVFDGQMLRIYTKEEVLAGMNATSVRLPDNQMSEEKKFLGESDTRININTATKSQLMTLPGIGSAKADIILDYREKEGAFDTIEDLMKIPGIKEGIFEQIKERIKVD